MELNTDKIDEAVLALLSLGRHDGYRVWKSFDWEVMNRLHQKGYITDPVSKARSVLLTEEGARESERLLRELFGRQPHAR
jgi:DNA-binding PadR family transcriptional regulator